MNQLEQIAQDLIDNIAPLIDYGTDDIVEKLTENVADGEGYFETRIIIGKDPTITVHYHAPNYSLVLTEIELEDRDDAGI